jgi:hypothetical protein
MAATAIKVVAMLQCILLATSNGQTVQSITELREQLSTRRLLFADSTIQMGQCVAIPFGETLTLTITVVETNIAKLHYLAILGLPNVYLSRPRGPPEAKRVTIHWIPTSNESRSGKEKRLCFRAFPRLGG